MTDGPLPKLPIASSVWSAQELADSPLEGTEPWLSTEGDDYQEE